MKNETAARLTAGRTLFLAVAATAAIAGPFASAVLTQTVIVTQTPPTPAPLSPDEPLPSFEVASVKPNTSGSGRIAIGAPSPDRMTLTNMPLREMIRFAYQVQPFQLIGDPGAAGGRRPGVDRFRMPMSRFARDLTMLARRMVVDRTGLAGRYDIDVQFTPEFRPQPPPGAPEFPVPAGAHRCLRRCRNSSGSSSNRRAVRSTC